MANEVSEFSALIGTEPKGLVKKIKDIILSNIPCSPEWAEMIALGDISAVCPDAYARNGFGRINAALILSFIGESGLTRKTIVLNTFCIAPMQQIQKNTGKTILFGRNFTYEGAIKKIANWNNEDEKQCSNLLYPGGLWARDEFTQVFKAKAAKNYQAELFEVLSEFWDGSVQSRWLSSMEIPSLDKVYFTAVVCSSEEFFNDVDMSMFDQGYGNRNLFMNDEYEAPFTELKFDRPDDLTMNYLEEYRDEIYIIAKILHSILEACPKMIYPSEEAEKLWNRYSEDIYQRLKKMRLGPKTRKPKYITRMAVTAMKLAMIHAIGRKFENVPVIQQGNDTIADIFNGKKQERELTNIEIDVDDMKYAIGKTELFYQYYEKILTKTRANGDEKNIIETNSGKKDLFVRYIAGVSDNIATVEEVVINTDVIDDDFNSKTRRVLNALVMQGRLFKVEQDEVERLPQDIIDRHNLKDGNKRFSAYSTKPFPFIR